MKDKKWTIEYKGLHIVVLNRLSFIPLRTSEALLVDGQIVAENKNSIFRLQASLNANIEIAGEPHRIEVRISNKEVKLTQLRSMGIGCHIFVNGELAGGDIDYELQYASAEKTRERSQKIHERGFWNLLFRCSIAGFAYAVVRTLFDMPETLTGVLTMIAFQTVAIGLILASVWWRINKSQLDGKVSTPKEQLNGIAKAAVVGIPLFAVLLFAANKFYIQDVDKTLRTVSGNVSSCQFQCNRDDSYNTHIFLSDSQPSHLRLIRPNSKQVDKEQIRSACKESTRLEIDYTSLFRRGQSEPHYRIQALRLADTNVTLISAEQSAAWARSNNRSNVILTGIVFGLWGMGYDCCYSF